jgi:hypothetical protein
MDPALISTLQNGPARTATLPLSDPRGAVVAWASAPLLVMGWFGRCLGGRCGLAGLAWRLY